MSRKIEADAADLAEALETALSQLLDSDPDEISIEAPGLEKITGDVRLDLRVRDLDDEREAEVSEVDVEQSDGDAAKPDEVEGRDEPSEVPASDDEPRFITPEELDEEADAAADFLEGLLDAMDLPGDLQIRVHDDHAEVEIVDVGSGVLIGRRGQTLESIQELLRGAMQRQFERRSRVKVDAEGYRARRLEKLLEKAEEAIDEVLETGEPERLEPMDVFERKAIHQLVAEVEGLTSRSHGREPARRVIIELDESAD